MNRTADLQPVATPVDTHRDEARSAARWSWAVVYVFFASPVYFGVLGLMGETHPPGGLGFLAVTGGLSVLFVAALASRLLTESREVARTRVRQRRRIGGSSVAILMALVFLVAVSATAAGLIYLDPAGVFEAQALLILLFAVPTLGLGLLIPYQAVSAADRPLLITSALVTGIFLVALVRAESPDSYEVLNSLGGASHLLVGGATSVACVLHFQAAVASNGLLARLLHGSVVASCSLLMFLSGSRGALASAAAVALLLLLSGKSVRGLLRGLLLVAGGALAIWWAVNLTGFSAGAVERFGRAFANDDASVDARFELSRMAWQGFLESPLWGHGVGAFAINAGQYVYPHNLVTESLYSLGLPVTVVLLALIVKAIGTWLADVRRRGGSASLFGAAFTVVVLLQLTTGSVFVNAPFWFGLAVLLRRRDALSTPLRSQ